MATVSIAIPDAQVARVVDAVCGRYGYGPGDGTKAQFARKVLAQWVRETVIEWERQQAAEAAGRTAKAAAELEISVS